MKYIPIILLALSLAACEDKHPPSDQGDTHAGHDHGDHEGHDHGGGEHADEVKLTADAIERYGIKVEEATLRLLQPTFTAPARVAFNSEAMAHVGSPLKGRAVEIQVKLGSNVKVGDALVIVESPDLGEAQSDYLMKKAAALNAAPAVDLAKVAWDRARGLFEQSQGITLRATAFSLKRTKQLRSGASLSV